MGEIAKIAGARHSLLEGAKGKAVRFRPKRYGLDALQGIGAEVRFESAQIPDGRARLVNFSRGGMAIDVDDVDGPIPIQAGEALESLTLRLGASLVLEARGRVVHHRRTPSGTRIGIQVVGAAFEPETVFRVRDALLLARRLEQEAEDLGSLLGTRISAPFKALVADARLSLERWKGALDEVERTWCDREDDEIRDVSRRVLDALEPGFAASFRAFTADLFRLGESMEPASFEASRRYAQAHLLPLLLESPVMRRAYSKPLGYAGDFRVMTDFYDDPDRGRTLFGRLIQRAGCTLAAPRATASRVSYLESQIAGVRDRRRGAGDVMSLGCGAAQEAFEFIRENPGAALHFTLIDQDAEALEHAHARLGRLIEETKARARLTFLQLSVRQLVRSADLASLCGDQDLIYAAGLFDYLEASVARRLIVRLHEMLRPEGRLAIGNFGVQCDTKGIMAFLLDWDIILRTEEELLGLLQGLDVRSARVEAEATGINWFLVVE